MAIRLHRCKAPTNYVCRCGRVARELKDLGIEYQTVRVSTSRRDRAEIEQLTGQSRVPVLVDGEQVVHDSKRIVEYLDAHYSSMRG